MITIDIKGLKNVQQMLATMPKAARRAAELALDATAQAIRDEIRRTMPLVFDRPTPYTLNSLKITPTRGHNLQASVWFKEPPRMGAHYLVPQVEGGVRALKGFERALGQQEFTPAMGARINQYGNVSPGQIRQILSVLKLAERSAGYSANLTARSAKRNRKDRDYVLITKQQGRLLPGIHQRFQTGVGFGHKTKRTLPFGTWQKGRTRGRFASVVRAKGLRPVLLMGRTGKQVKPRLDFYTIGHKEFQRRFGPLFWNHFRRQVSA